MLNAFKPCVNSNGVKDAYSARYRVWEFDNQETHQINFRADATSIFDNDKFGLRAKGGITVKVNKREEKQK